MGAVLGWLKKTGRHFTVYDKDIVKYLLFLREQ